MDIRNVTNLGNIDRSGERNRRAEPKSAEAATPVVKDDARISDASRGKAARVESLADRARDVGDRDAIVEAARQKLVSGELDGDAALSSTAQRLLDSDFLTA